VPTKELKNKPLIEAIFELRWELQEQEGEIKTDPHYKLLIGRIYDRVKSKYSFYEQLRTAAMPDEVAGYVVQHRFRADKDKWPLVQIGPGIMTLNDTDGYTWHDFEKRASHLLDTLFEVYPSAEKDLRVNRLLLRYIDAIDFDYAKDAIFPFLKKKMKIHVEIHSELFEDTGVGKSPLDLDLKFTLPSAKPKGAVLLRFVRGQRNGADALIWETMVQSIGDDSPKAKDRILTWVREAHDLTHAWFLKMIEGELRRRFE